MAIDSMPRGWGNWLKASFQASSSGGGWLRDEKGESIHSNVVIPETSSVFSGSLVPARQSTSSDFVTVDVRKALESPVHHLQPINSISTTPKNFGLAHVQLASDETWRWTYKMIGSVGVRVFWLWPWILRGKL